MSGSGSAPHEKDSSVEGLRFAPSGCERPWCCPEPRCRPVHQLKNGDLRIPAPGDSFICFGQMPQGIAFSYDGDRHENDLRSCHYTPLKGVVANQENADDWAMVGRAYATALKALREIQAEGLSAVAPKRGSGDG